jgi:hypothetical protein
MNICYVTAYYDIGRSSWGNFTRTFDDYLKSFEPYINLFKTDKSDGDILVVFIDKKCEQQLRTFIKDVSQGNPVSINIIPIDNEFMNTLPMWKTLEREREIMVNQDFKNLLGPRQNFPEHIHPEYTLINHCKIDLICSLIDSDKFGFEFYAWVDFGFFNRKENIPERLLDINKLDINTVNYSLINDIDERDKDIVYTLQIAPEKIGGFFFFGRKDILKQYQKLYHDTLKSFQNHLSIADDDQHLALRCYFKKPELFTLHNLGKWHVVLKKFQK